MRRTRRILGPEEAALWSEIARTIRPLRGIDARDTGPTATPDIQVQGVPKPVLPPSLAPFEISARVAPEPKMRVSQQAEPALRMDARAYARMRKGRLVPEARIDLHGMTVAEAHSALNGFLIRAHGSGLRLVLVITGKGKPVSEQGSAGPKGGVLRHQVPHWLRLPPLGPRVLQVAEAHLSHGGSGALYVYLKKAA